MNRILALAFIAVGVVLLIFGCCGYFSTASGASRAMTGAPPDASVWLIVAGLLAGITGVFGLTPDHSK